MAVVDSSVEVGGSDYVLRGAVNVDFETVFGVKVARKRSDGGECRDGDRDLQVFRGPTGHVTGVR